MSTRARWGLTALFALLPLLGWWATGLFDLDEGFYAAVVGEMNRRGEWITPYFNGSPWFEKPILLYWLAKPTVALFGETIGPRIPAVLATLATYAIVAYFAVRHVRTNPEAHDDLESGARVGVASVLILASSLLVVALGRMMMTDAPLMFALTGAFFTFWESLVGDRRWRWATAALLGIGVLAKGPVAILLFIPVAAITYARQPDLRPAFRGNWLVGTAILFLVVASWYLPAYLQNGQFFVQKFLIEQNIGRFTGGDAAHTLGISSLPLYIPILVLGMLPWSFWIPKSWPRSSEDRVGRYLGTWALTIFLFFSLSGAKLPHYILPLFPPLALLVGRRLADRRWIFATGAALCVAMSMIANVGFSAWYQASGQKEAHRLARILRQEGGDVAVYQLSRRQKDRGTGKPKLQETSLPSMLLYLDKTALDTDDFSELLTHPAPLWIFTRSDRIQTEDFVMAVKANRRLSKRPLPGDENYALFRLE